MKERVAMSDFVVYVDTKSGLAIAEARDNEGFEETQHILSPQLYEALKVELEQLFKVE
jgi:type I site-specific restriction endonuclease